MDIGYYFSAIFVWMTVDLFISFLDNNNKNNYDWCNQNHSTELVITTCIRIKWACIKVWLIQYVSWQGAKEVQKSRVADPGEDDPYPDPTLKKQPVPGSDPQKTTRAGSEPQKTTRVGIRPSKNNPYPDPTLKKQPVSGSDPQKTTRIQIRPS